MSNELEQSKGKSNWRATLDLATTIVMLFAASLLVWRATVGMSAKKTSAPALTKPAVPVSVAGAALKGNSETGAVMIEFSDFQCPFCGKFTREILPTIVKDYVNTGKVAIAFRHLPLTIHPEAFGSAVAATCAQEEGHFWEMHDLLFAPQANITETGRRAMATSIGLAEPGFETCTTGSRARELVDKDMALAKSLGIAGTPAFLFGLLDETRSAARIQAVLSGARPVSEFTAALDLLIQRGKQ